MKLKNFGWRNLAIFLVIFISLIIFSACSKGEKPMLKADSLKLPETIDGWTLSGPPQKITRETIFDYIDGGGELYLAYKFNQLMVWKYQSEKDSENEIVVEVYEMQNPQETFGLLSLDWTGEPVALKPEPETPPESPVSPTFTALYGDGLLRARVDNLYLRILASRETPIIKETILNLGKIIAAEGSHSTLPDILAVLKSKVGSSWQIKKERTSYFHSYLILNSLYYLSHENILHLGPDCEAIYTEWENKKTGNKKSVRMIIIKYPSHQAASQALDEFKPAYVPEKAAAEVKPSSPEVEKALPLEDGWAGWKLDGNFLTLVFEAPDESAVEELFSLGSLK
ncbi:MAG: DUF6599 family protein [Candidatus Saccharicenans sp.]